MSQRFEKKIQKLLTQEGLGLISLTELEDNLLYCVHLEVLTEGRVDVGVALPADTFMISCYRAKPSNSFQTLFCSSTPTLVPYKAGFLKAGEHLILIGKTNWFWSTLKRFSMGSKKRLHSDLGHLHYCDAPITKTMLFRQTELIFKERLSHPRLMDLHGFSLLLLSEWDTIQETMSKVELGRDKWLVSQTMRLMEQHLEGDPLSLDSIAQTLAVSVSKLKIAFRQEMGISVYRHYLNLRLERAKTLLNSNNYNVSEVAYRIGYNSVSKFSKMFAEYHGFLPSYYAKINVLEV